MRARQGRSATGFTLIELMIVVVVVAILGSIAYPSYIKYTARSRRSDAQQLMQEISLKEGQYILDARQYTTTLGPGSPTTGGLNINRQGWTCSTNCTNAYYTISVAINMSATPPTYAITGTPVTGSVVDGDGILTLDNTGTRQRLVNSVDQGW